MSSEGANGGTRRREESQWRPRSQKPKTDAFLRSLLKSGSIISKQPWQKAIPASVVLYYRSTDLVLVRALRGGGLMIPIDSSSTAVKVPMLTNDKGWGCVFDSF